MELEKQNRPKPLKGQRIRTTQYRDYSPHLDAQAVSADQRRTPAQYVCLAAGVIFLILGLVGFVIPDLMSAHLSWTHNTIHIISGLISLWYGAGSFEESTEKFCYSIGIFYGLLGVAGFLFGAPGLPTVGHSETDQFLIKVVPGALELGVADHVIHILLSSAFIGGALLSRRIPRPTYH